LKLEPFFLFFILFLSFFLFFVGSNRKDLGTSFSIWVFNFLRMTTSIMGTINAAGTALTQSAR
jgi:hypothetical protein